MSDEPKSPLMIGPLIPFLCEYRKPDGLYGITGASSGGQLRRTGRADHLGRPARNHTVRHAAQS